MGCCDDADQIEDVSWGVGGVCGDSGGVGMGVGVGVGIAGL